LWIICFPTVYLDRSIDVSGAGSWGGMAKELGGGQFFSHGCHYVDLMLRFLGNLVKGVHMGTNLGTRLPPH